VAVFLHPAPYDIFQNKISFSSVLDSVCLHTGLKTDYSIFNIHNQFKVLPSAICVSAAEIICKNIAISKVTFTKFPSLS
jgi:hypothetical protein